MDLTADMLKDAQTRIEALETKLAQVNGIIFAAGAPLGSERYFQIREIVAPFGRKHYHAHHRHQSQ